MHSIQISYTYSIRAELLLLLDFPLKVMRNIRLPLHHQNEDFKEEANIGPILPIQPDFLVC